MGIKHLHKILKKYAPNCYDSVSLSEFAYKRIAIDVSLYLYKYKAIAGDQWLDSFVNLVCCLRKWNIHCVFVYDSKAPIEKEDEQKRRRVTRAKQTDRVKDLEDELQEYQKNGKIGEKIMEISKNEKPISLLRKLDIKIDTDLVQQKINSMKSMIISITEAELQITRNLCDILEIPYLKAISEAEAYCSYLAIHGKVDAVLSEDTDVIAYGAPIFLTKLDIYREIVTVITYEKILKETEMIKPTFVDLCIMCGCDYNSNIPKIGPEKSYLLMKKYGTIDKINEDTSTLHHIRVRELFSIPESIDVAIPYCGIPDFAAVNKFMAKNNIKINIAKLQKNLGQSELSFIEE